MLAIICTKLDWEDFENIVIKATVRLVFFGKFLLLFIYLMRLTIILFPTVLEVYFWFVIYSWYKKISSPPEE